MMEKKCSKVLLLLLMMEKKCSKVLLLLLLSLAGRLSQAVSDSNIKDNKLACQPGSHSVAAPPESSPENPIDPNSSSYSRAPAKFAVHFGTSASDDTVLSLEVTRAWSPAGADRFYQLVLDNYYDCAAFFRVVPGFVVQFGLTADPEETSKWINSPIADDKPAQRHRQSNVQGTVSFAMAGPNTRTAQVFVNLEDNARLDDSGFTPFAVVTSGLDVLQNIYNPTPRDSGGVSQSRLVEEGNEWLLQQYPEIEIIKSTKLEVLLMKDEEEKENGEGDDTKGAVQMDNKLDCQAGPHTITPSNDDDDTPPRAPEQFEVHWKTTASEETLLSIQVTREWSPAGADRFYKLILDNFFNCAAFFRVVPGFVVQFGIAAEPAESHKWSAVEIQDDPTGVQSNVQGTVSFASAGTNTRTSQIFVNLRDNVRLDDSGFTPFAVVTAGMDVLQTIYNPTPGKSDGVSQSRLERKGNQWLLKKYPLIELIENTTLVVLKPAKNNDDDNEQTPAASSSSSTQHSNTAAAASTEKKSPAAHHENADQSSSSSSGGSSPLKSLDNHKNKNNNRKVGKVTPWIAVALVVEAALVVVFSRRSR